MKLIDYYRMLDMPEMDIEEARQYTNLNRCLSRYEIDKIDEQVQREIENG